MPEKNDDLNILAGFDESVIGCLTAGHALTDDFIRVWADQHPPAAPTSNDHLIYAVFHPEEDHTFLGLVPAGKISRYPQRIFADLLPRPAQKPLQEDVSLYAFLDLYRDGDTVMPVVDSDGALLGVVTSNSLLQALLRCRCDRQVCSDLPKKSGEMHHRLPLENQNHLSAMVFEHSQAAILITNSKEQIVAVNPAFSFLTGYQPQEIIGKTPRILSSGDNDANFYRQMWESIARQGEWQGEIRNRRKNGELYSEWLKINAVYDDSDSITHYIATFFDITERIHSDKRIERLINYDTLTGLPNRSLAREQIKQGLMAAKGCDKMVALLFIDLDHFKDVNDSLGHLVGDQLLQVAAKRMLSCVRSHLEIQDEDIIARQGGDEFTLLLCNMASKNEVAIVAQRLLESFQEPISVAGNTLYLSLSIGITLYPQDVDTIDDLISRADLAMYEAKRSGRNTYCFFDRDMAQRSSESLILKNALHRALENREFFLEYQPRVTMVGDRIIAFEALMRWLHPEQGVIPPLKFIPLLEERGLIDDIGHWLLLEACSQCRSWQSATGNNGLIVAVNLSAKQFQNPNIVEDIEKALHQSRLAPHCLEIELTESAAIQDVTKTMRILEELSSLGVRCSMDDFGTGYSSLSYLRDFQLTTLKIDKSFVTHIPHQEKDNAVVRAIITTAHSLGMKVVAEGVERIEQREFLHQEGCEEFQGYLFSRPLKAGEALGLLENSTSNWME